MRRLLPWTAALLLLAASPRAQADSRQVWRHAPGQGFLEEALAFSADGHQLALIHTDNATFLTLKVLDTATFKVSHSISLRDATAIPQRLAFTADGARLLLIWADARQGQYHASLFDLASGKQLRQVGPANRAELVDYKGELMLTLSSSSADRAGASRFQITAYRTRDLTRRGAARATVQADGTLTQPALRLLYWEPGHLTLMGMRKGSYDKQRDIRLPERAVRYDVLAKKELWSQEPKDLVDWAKATNMRPDHPQQHRFVQVSDDLKSLLYVDRDNNLASLSTPVKWSLYEPKSLQQQESGGREQLYFSLTVDPVNPEAVARKKADKERMDLYQLKEGPQAVLLGQVLTDKRGFTWTAGPGYFAYLRKLKGFGRGGDQLTIYRLTP